MEITASLQAWERHEALVRVMAARKLGLSEVPVIELAHLSETQKRAYILADNKLALNAGWDEELLRVELDALRKVDFDLSLTGFELGDLDALLAGEESTLEGNIDENAAPEAQEATVSQPGDLWVMGGHRLLCGDATKESDYALLMQGTVARMIVTDPPYNVAYEGAAGSIQNDDLGTEFYAFLLAAFRGMLPCCDGGVYIAMSSSELDTLQKAFRDAGGHCARASRRCQRSSSGRRIDLPLAGMITRATRGSREAVRTHPLWLAGGRVAALVRRPGSGRCMVETFDAAQIKRPVKNDLHPTMKPVEVMERAIRNSSRPGDVVLDPFGGSGTTLIAAEKSGRHARIIELESKFVDVIVRRWQEFSGGKAVREADGVVFGTATKGLQ